MTVQGAANPPPASVAQSPARMQAQRSEGESTYVNRAPREQKPTGKSSYCNAIEASSSAEIMDSRVKDLLSQYEDVFSEPQGLPPTRMHDHAIPLVANANPVNLKAYSSDDGWNLQRGWLVTHSGQQQWWSRVSFAPAKAVVVDDSRSYSRRCRADRRHPFPLFSPDEQSSDSNGGRRWWLAISLPLRRGSLAGGVFELTAVTVFFFGEAWTKQKI
nr:retrotransposon protein, putative, unclassified [Ipomoea batatas]